MDELSYNGKNFSEFNTFFDGSKAFGSPEKDYELVEIMGRNGSLSIYNDRFKDILLPFPCFVRSAFLTHYRQLVEFLNSQHGYLRLETSKEPNHFRKALFQGIVEPQTTPFNHGGQFTINFLAKPQRFLKSGETPVSSQSQDEEYEGNPVSINNPSGLSNVKSLEVGLSPIQNLNGYDYPWAGGAGKNILDLSILRQGNFDNTVSTSNVSFDEYLPIKSETEYVWSTEVSNISGRYLRFYDSSKTYLSDADINLYGVGVKTFTTPANASYYRAMWYLSGGLSPSDITADQIELGSTATSYAPYSNICPISGHTEVTVTRTGKNICNGFLSGSTTDKDITFENVDDGGSGTWHIKITGTSTAGNATSGNKFFGGWTNPYVPIVFRANTTYTFSLTNVTTTPNLRVMLRGESGNTNLWYGDSTTGVWTFTPTVDLTVYKMAWRVTASGSVMNVDGYLQIEEGNKATPYEPYTSTTKTTSLGTTVYGGTLDLTTGVLTTNRIVIDLDTITTGWQTATVNSKAVLRRKMDDIASGTGVTQTLMCSHLNYTGNSTSNVADGTINNLTSNYYNLTLCLPNEFTTQATLNAWTAAQKTNGTPVQLSYKLATPTTTQLTAEQISLLTGINIISTDGDTLTVTVTEPSLLVNPTLFESKPLLRIYGTGTVTINNQYITISAHSFPYIDIDCELMDAFYGSSNANSYVTFSDNDYITLKPGNNYIAYGNQIEVTPRWFEI